MRCPQVSFDSNQRCAGCRHIPRTRPLSPRYLLVEHVRCQRRSNRPAPASTGIPPTAGKSGVGATDSVDPRVRAARWPAACALLSTRRRSRTVVHRLVQFRVIVCRQEPLDNTLKSRKVKGRSCGGGRYPMCQGSGFTRSVRSSRLGLIVEDQAWSATRRTRPLNRPREVGTPGSPGRCHE